MVAPFSFITYLKFVSGKSVVILICIDHLVCYKRLKMDIMLKKILFLMHRDKTN